mmetsp:Transcript_6006/g.17739  ORF Transcript_6006/g.17739 Transcript_6006/m.17739 type:complete len:273 (+) Transcript_6006:205-1023(+)
MPWQTTPRDRLMLATASSCVLFSGSLPARSMKPAAKLQGRISRATGAEPTSMGTRGRFRIPVMTEVGQSGPPTSTETFAKLMPLSLRMYLMDFMSGVCTAMNFFTATLLAMGTPIAFCSSATAVSFSTRQKRKDAKTPSQKLWPASSTLGMMTMPPIMYSGMPATGGKRKSRISTTKSRPAAAPSDQGATASLNQARKSTRPWLTPTCTRKNAIPQYIDFVRMEVQSQLRACSQCSHASLVVQRKLSSGCSSSDPQCLWHLRASWCRNSSAR